MGRSSNLLLWCSLISSHHLCHEAAHGLDGFVLLFLCLFPLPILLQEVCDLLWHRYLRTVVDDND